MNKKLIPFAVAAALTVPFAAQAEVTIYGKANVSYDGVKCDGEKRYYKITSNSAESCNQIVDLDVVTDADGNPIGVVGVAGNYGPENRASRLGFKGSEDLGNGLKAIWKMEFSVDMADNAAVGSTRNAYVGLAGDAWGTALIGRHDTPYKLATAKLDYFSDQLADFNGTIGFEDLRAQNAAAYISPNWGGFTLAAAIVAPGSLFGQGSDVGRDAAEAYSISGVYDNGGIFVSAAYERFDKGWVENEVGFATGTAEVDGVIVPLLIVDPTSAPAKSKWKLGGGWDGEVFGISGIWESRNKQGNLSDADVDSWQIQGKYNFGNNTIKGMFGNTDPDWESDYNSWAVGWDYNFTRRTQIYLQYADQDDHWNGYSLGVTHNF